MWTDPPAPASAYVGSGTPKKTSWFCAILLHASRALGTVPPTGVQSRRDVPWNVHVAMVVVTVIVKRVVSAHCCSVAGRAACESPSHAQLSGPRETAASTEHE